MKFAFINQHRDCWPVEMMCRVLAVSRSGYFAWRSRPPSNRRQRAAELTEQIRTLHAQHRRVYGSPRVYQMLRRQGVKACENTVAKLMRQAGIRAKTKRSFVPRTTDSSQTPCPAPNVLARDFGVGAPNCRWVSDLTYVPTAEGWLYLAAVLDLGTRRVVGWAMEESMAASLPCAALEMALQQRSIAKPAKASSTVADKGVGLLHHSDRGSQYASDAYQQVLTSYGMTASMSGTGNCYDNAAMESFFATLKTELVYQETFTTREEAKLALFEYIEVFYNRERIHSALGYLSPEAFEASLM